MVNESYQNSIQPLVIATREIAGSFWYWLLGIAVFCGTLLFAIWLPNLSFLRHAAVSPDYAIGQKFSLLVSSLGALNTNFTPLSRILTIIIALLFALNVVLVVFYMKRRVLLQRSMGLGIGGILSGLIGVGCAACGSVLLSSIFGIGATASFIGILPLKGQEFGILSVVILGWSIFFTARRIQNPTICLP